MYKKNIINELRFNEKIIIGEDVDFLYRALKNIKYSIVDTNNIVYKYRIRKNSASHSKYNNNIEKEIEIAELMINDIKDSEKSLLKNAIRRYQRVNVSCMIKYFREYGNIKGTEHLVKNIKKYKMCLDIEYLFKYILILYFSPVLKIIMK